jgi:hypothetical protein
MTFIETIPPALADGVVAVMYRRQEAGRAFFTKVLDALGVEPDSPFLALDESFRRTLTVGRAIDVCECVTMPVAEPLPGSGAPGLGEPKSTLCRMDR